MFPSNVRVDLRRLLALQLTVWTLESWIVSALVLVMPIAVTFQRETVQTPRAVVNRTHVSHRLGAGRRHANQRIQHAQI